LRIQTVLELKTTTFLQFALSPYTRNDQAASADILSCLEKGDLVLRDLGYHVTNVFQKIHDNGAFFLSKYHYPVALFDPNTGSRIRLLKKLRKQGNMDIWVRMGTKTTLFVRIVAIKLSKKEALKRRKSLQNHPDRRMHPSKEHLALCAWAIYITNATQQSLPLQIISQVYGLRWQIEVVFKTWKSHCHFKSISPFATKELIEASIYAKLIYVMLFFENLLKPVAKIFQQKSPRNISLLKYLRIMNTCSSLVKMASATATQWPKDYWNQFLIKHCSYELRRDRMNYPQKLMALT
jgi:hypothetical protein